MGVLLVAGNQHRKHLQTVWEGALPLRLYPPVRTTQETVSKKPTQHGNSMQFDENTTPSIGNTHQHDGNTTLRVDKPDLCHGNTTPSIRNTHQHDSNITLRIGKPDHGNASLRGDNHKQCDSNPLFKLCFCIPAWIVRWTNNNILAEEDYLEGVHTRKPLRWSLETLKHINYAFWAASVNLMHFYKLKISILLYAV